MRFLTKVLVGVTGSLLILLGILPAQALSKHRNTSVYGPQKYITCPSGSVDVQPGIHTIQDAIAAHPPGTSYCIRAGTYNLDSPVVPQTGDTLTGEFGAILDGTNIPAVSTNGVIRGWNFDSADNVTVRNLVLRNFATEGGACVSTVTPRTGWIIDHNEMSGCSRGLKYGDNFTVTNNFIHHNIRYGINSFNGSGNRFEQNEISYNNTGNFSQADEGGSKFAGPSFSNNVILNNYFHDNNGHSIWLDGAGTVNRVEGNTVVQNVRGKGIDIEVSGSTVVTSNNVTTSQEGGIFISTSQNVEVSFNTVTSSGTTFNGAIMSFYDGNRGEQAINNSFHDNTVKLAGAATHAAAIYEQNGTNPDRATITFVHNTYILPALDSLSFGFYVNPGWQTFTAWQAAGYDTAGLVQVPGNLGSFVTASNLPRGMIFTHPSGVA